MMLNPILQITPLFQVPLPLSNGITITEVTIVAVISLLGGLLGSIILSGTQLFKWKSGEQRKYESDSAGLMTSAATALIAPLKQEIDTLRNENKTLKEQRDSEISSLEDKNKSLATRIDDVEKAWVDKFEAIRDDYNQLERELIMFKNWAARLVHQVYSLGGEPVPMILKSPLDNKDNNTEE